MDAIEDLRDLLSEPYSSVLDKRLEVDKILQSGIIMKLKSSSSASGRKGSLYNLFYYFYHNSTKIEFTEYGFLGWYMTSGSKWKVEWLNHKKQTQQIQEITISDYDKIFMEKAVKIQEVMSVILN